MKAVVVYYSLEENTKYVAEKIKEFIDVDILRLKPKKEYPKGNFIKYFWGGMSVVLGKKPKLVPYDINISDYDLIIFGTPIWAGSFAPPIKTFLSENNFENKKIALFSCCAGGNPQTCLENLKKELPNNKIISYLNLVNPKQNPSESNEQKIKEFCSELNI